MRNSFALLLLASFVAGCASTASVEVDKKVASEQVTLAPGEVTNRGHEAILNSKKLTAEQKQKIIKIMDRVHSENLALKEESNKLKITFFKTLAEQGYKADQVSVMKDRLQKIENKKMDLMFSSLDEVQSVLGVTRDRDHKDMDEIFRAMGGNAEI